MTDRNRNILLTQDQSTQVSAIGSRFERAWQQGQQPTIEAVAAGIDSHIRPALLQHLAELDIQCRVGRGSPVALEMYLARWPDLDRSELQRALESAQKNGETSVIAADRSAAASTSPQRATLLCSSIEFLQRLRESRLLSDAELPWPAADTTLDEPAGLIAQRLVDAKKLTAFQAEWLLDGEGDPLTLDEYVVQDFVGRGGMGTVYRAVHRRMKRTVALKVLRRDIPHSDVLAKRFLREVEVAAKLCHPNIVTAYDAGEHNGVSYLVCEFVEGQNLSELVRQYGPLSLPLAVDIIQQAARALEYVHGEGIIHRDIKPSNLLLDDAGNVKLLDVGLARITQPDLSDPDQSSDLTATGMIMGTVDYMSPEQALNTSLANEQSDLYSLGCTLYFLITGRVPFSSGTGFERLLAHREQAIPSLRILCGQFPMELDSLLAAMLAKKPADRIASMTELGRRLEELKSIGLPDVTLPLRPDDEPLPVTAIGTRTGPDDGPAIVGMHDMERPILHAAPEQAAASTWIAPAAPPMADQISSLPRTIPRSRSSSGWLWVLGPGLLALAVAAWITRPDPTTSDRAAAVTPKGRPDLDRVLAAPLTDMSEGEVSAYRTEWASRLKVSEQKLIGGIAFVLIPPGRFMFGEGANARDVVRTPAYWMSETEVTTAQFRGFVNATPGFQTVAEIHGTGWGVDPVTNIWRQGAEFRWDNLGANFVNDDSPATSIAYPDALAFCEWMSNITQKVVRLPTEEEWEFACRCGRRGTWCFGDDREQLSDYGWHLGNSENRVHSVRLRKANAWGLYDMHGNESEWILAPEAAVRSFEGQGLVRGGGFYSSPEETGSSSQLETELAQPTKGAFRLVAEF